MKKRQRIRVKAPSQSAVPPIQVKSLQSRPFAPTPNPATQQQSVPSIQAQLDGAKRFGYDLSNILSSHRVAFLDSNRTDNTPYTAIPERTPVEEQNTNTPYAAIPGRISAEEQSTYTPYGAIPRTEEQSTNTPYAAIPGRIPSVNSGWARSQPVPQPVGSDNARAVNLGWARSQPVGSDDARAVNLGWVRSQPVTQPVGSDDARAVNLGWARSQPVGSDDARAVNLGWAQSQPVTQPVGNDNALAGNPRLLYQRAQELFRLKNYVEAAQYFEKAYSLDNKAQLALNAAGSYREAGIRDRAIEWYKKALLTNPTEAQREEALENFKGFNVSADVYIEVADACRQTGRIKEAISYYVRCHYQLSGNSDPAAYQQVVDKLLSIISDPKILSNIAVDYAEQGDFEQAALFSEQAFALDNQSAQLAFNCARAYENAGQLGRAKHFYTACLDIAPENVAAQEGLQRIEAMPTLPKDNGRGAKNQYEGIGMLRGHGYETENQSKDVNNNQEHWKERVKYLTEQERQQHKVSVRGGKLYQGNKELDTRNADAMAKGTVSGRMIFVMSTSGAIYAADMVGEMKKSGALIYELIESERKAWNLGRQIYYHRLQKSEVEKFHHSSLLAGEEVAGAGELQVGVENSAGTLEVVSDASGHYRPAPHITQNVLQEFNRKGVDLTSVRVQILARGGSEIPARDFLSENKQNLKNEGTGLAYQQAIADYEKGEYLSAAGLFQRAFEFTNSSEFELAYSVGISYFKASEWKQAKLYFEKCLRLNPNTDIRSQAQRYLNSPELNSGLRNI